MLIYFPFPDISFTDPKGLAFYIFEKGTKISPFMHGGGQEEGRRGGTYNTPAIVGLGKAVEIASAEMGAEAERLVSLRDRLIKV